MISKPRSLEALTQPISMQAVASAELLITAVEVFIKLTYVVGAISKF